MNLVRPLAWMIAVCAGAAATAQDAAPEGDAPAAEMRSSDVSGAAPPETVCPVAAERRRGVRLARALEQGFGVQYWGEGYTAETLAAQPHGLLILEAAKVGAPFSSTGREDFFTPEEIALINRAGERPVLGYLNIGEIENYRDYWVEFATRQASFDNLPDWFGPHAGHGDHLAAFWVDSWRAILLERIDRLMAAGVDGVFLDDVLHYYSHATDGDLVWPAGSRPAGPETAPGLAQAMMRLVIDLAARARAGNCDAYVVVNNAAFIGRDAAEEGGARPVFDAYLSAIDAILAENVLAPTGHQTTRDALREDFLDNGVQVLTLDALSRFPDPERDGLQRRLAAQAAEAGFVPYLVEDEGFNRLFPPVPAPEKS